MRDFSRSPGRSLPVVLLVLAACATSPAITVVRRTPGDRLEDIQGDSVKLKRRSEETLSGAHGGFYVVRGPEDWERAWPADRNPPMPATLDTSSQMLFLAVSGSRDITRMKIERATETATFLYVWVSETTVGEGCANTSPDRAFDAVVAPRNDKPVKFFVDAKTGESCGKPPTAGVECRLKGQQTWSPKIEAQPGDSIECTMTASAPGKFALVDKLLSVADLPAGSSAKLVFKKGAERGELAVDVYGTYGIMAEATDEAGRRGKASATIAVKPPKTKDVLVQLVWAGFDRNDTADTFPRVNLRIAEEGPQGQRCSAEIPIPGLCEVKTGGAYTYMRVPEGNRRLPISVQFLDERVEKGPGPCVHVWYDGVRTGETCDRSHRDADEIWRVGVLDTTTGKLLPEASTAAAPMPNAGAEERTPTTK